jgi:hypothetical protein
MLTVAADNNFCADAVDGMEAIRRDLESAVAAAATACDDEAKVAVPIAGEASADQKGASAEEQVRPEPVDVGRGEAFANGGSNVECTEVPKETDAVTPDEVQTIKDSPAACGEGEESTTTPPALSEMEVSTVTPDTCAEVEVSTSSPEGVHVKSEMKEEQIQNAVEGNNDLKEVSYSVMLGTLHIWN